MLSKKDIYKELGKGINIVPLKEENIKENSINVTISEYAWTTGEGIVCWCGDSEFHLKNSLSDPSKALQTYGFKKHNKAIFICKGAGRKPVKKYLILLPHQTTIVETEEVIGLGENIGGAIHSKVGIVAKGIGDTGTMLGPGYCGHLMLSLHNITDDVIALPIRTTFVSLTFDKLLTPVKRTSSTSSSHYDKLLELNLYLSAEDAAYFKQDWKGNLQEIRVKLKESKEYSTLKSKRKKAHIQDIKDWFTIQHVMALILVIIIVVSLGFLANYVDKGSSTKVWTDRYWMLLVASLLAYLVPSCLSKMFS